MTEQPRRLYRQWIVANGWSELLGLGGTFLLGYAGASLLTGASSVAATLLAALAAILLGTFLEGVLVGYAQGRVLHAHLPGLAVRRWVGATALGAGAAWTLGMLPSTLISLMTADSPATSSSPPDIQGLTQYVLAAGMGAVLGSFLGVPQSRVLRHHAARAGRWILANVAAWAAGMPLVFAGMDLVGPAPGPVRLVIGVALTCLATGLVVGAVHGLWLCALLRKDGAGLASTNPA